VKVNGYDIDISRADGGTHPIRLYQPSLHLFNGSQANAELIIQHTGPGEPVLVCVPITERGGKGKANSFFSQIIPHAVSGKDESQGINVSNWSLNDVVPSAPFYFYIGAYPFQPCNGKINTIVFELKDAAAISSTDLNTLRSLISPVDYTQAQTMGSTASSTPLLMKNTNPGSMGPDAEGKNYYIFDQCQAIDGMDDDTPSKKARQDDKGLPSWIPIMMGILMALILLALVYSVIINFGSDKGSSSSDPIVYATLVKGQSKEL